MKFGKSLMVAAVAAAALLMGVAPAQAQPGRHPAYLRALSDLRLMRAYLQRVGPNERIDDESYQAIRQIDFAINAIKQASIDDGRDPKWVPPTDAGVTPGSRFRKAREAGTAAWNDLNREEDNEYGNGLRRRALQYVEAANHIVDHILRRWQ